MIRFPFSGFPHPYYNRYYNYQYNKSINQNSVSSNKQATPSPVRAEFTNTGSLSQSSKNKVDEQQNRKISSRNNSFLPFSFSFDGFSDYDNPIIEIFGIKLFIDDIIILGLLFLLYEEGVKDEMLFIALLLLLLT